MRPWVRGYRQLALAPIVVAAISFGCSSSQQRKDDGPANRPGNDTTQSAAPAAEGPSFAGTWERDDGLVLLVSDDGSKVEGVFQSSGDANAFELYSLSLERTAPDKLSGSAFWRHGELSAATNWEVSRLDESTLLARVEYVDMDPEAGNRIVNRGWREREIHFEPTAEAVAEAAAAEAAAAAAEEAAAKVAAEAAAAEEAAAAAKVAAEEAAVAAAAEEAAATAAAEAVAAEEAAAAAKVAAEEAAAKAAAEEAAIVAAAKAAAEEVAIAAAAKEAELAAAKAVEERAAKEAELAAAAAEERAVKEAELAAAKEAELAAAKEAELAAAKEAELVAAKEAEAKRIAEEAEAARLAEAAEAKRIAEEAEAARLAEAEEAKRIAAEAEAEAARLAAAEEAKRIAAEAEAEAARLAAAEEAKRIAAEVEAEAARLAAAEEAKRIAAEAEAARLAAAEEAAAEPKLSFAEAIRSLDTWGQAFLEALKGGDSGAIEAFVLNEADCIKLLGPSDGKAMAQNLGEAHRETFAPLLKQHPDISRGEFKAFRHDAPEPMNAGDEGLIVDTRAIWEASLVYVVDGVEKTFPIYNLLEADGSWKAVLLAPPE